MTPIISSAVFAVCALLCASQPVEKLPVLRQLPAEVVFQDGTELVLECATEGKEDGVNYQWLKDGKPYTPITKVSQRGNEGALIFKNPTASEEGVYQCLAESPLGVASSRPVHVRRSFMDTPLVEHQKHTPVEGRTYKLECKIPNAYPKPEIVWMVESEKSKEVVAGQRFTISDEGDLYMSNVTKEDVGNKKYQCLAKSPALNSVALLAEHELVKVVEDGPGDNEVVQQYVTKDTTLKAGESVYLYCIYGGNPLAHPDWFKDGKDINNSPKDRVTRYNKSVGKRLLIKEVLLQDEGEYSCTVDNEVGKAQKHTFHVKVVILHNNSPKDLNNSPKDLNNSPKDRVTRYNKSVGKRLLIKEVLLQDEGEYSCTVDNEVGKAQKHTFHVKVVSAPRFLKQPEQKIVVKEGEDVTIPCQIEAVPEAKLSWTYNSKNIPEKIHVHNSSQGNQVSSDLVMKKVQKSNTGYYGCKAQNEYGDVYAESLLYVQ